MCYSSLCVCVFFFGGGGVHFNQKGEDIAKYQLARYMHVFILFFKCEFFFFSKISDVAFLVAFQPKRGRHCKVLASQVYACFFFFFFFTCEFFFFFFLKFLMQLFQQQLYIYYYFSHLYTSITICQPRNSFSSLI